MSAKVSTIQKYMYDQSQYNGNIHKKNFIQENMRQIKKVQNGRFIKNQNNKKKIHKRAGNEEKHVFQPISGHEKPFKFCLPETPETEVELRTYKEKSCQTLSNSKYAYNEGVILYPTARPQTPPPRSGRKDAALQTSLTAINRQVTPSVSDSSSGKIPVRDDGKIDFVKLNATVQIKKRSNSKKRDPTKAPPNYQRGVVPKYLREAKKQQLEEIKEKGIAEELEDDTNCPEGHVLLSEEEKKEHLKKIRSTYAELVSQLNLLPMKSDSLKVKTKRELLEKDLRKLEDGIKLFSREKLYIRVN